MTEGSLRVFLCCFANRVVDITRLKSAATPSSLPRAVHISFQPFLLCTSSNCLCFVRRPGNCKSPGRNYDLFQHYFLSAPCRLSLTLFVSHFFFHCSFLYIFSFPHLCSLLPKSFSLLLLKRLPLSPFPPSLLAVSEKQ